MSIGEKYNISHPMIAYLEDQTPIAELPTNCLSVFGHFVGLALKGLSFRRFILSRISQWVKKMSNFIIKLIFPWKEDLNAIVRELDNDDQ